MSQTVGKRAAPYLKPAMGVLVLLVLLGTISAATYFSVVAQGAGIPPMPRISLTPEEERQAIDRLVRRTEDFNPNEREQSVIGQLESLHLAETSLDIPPVSPTRIKQMTENLKSSLSGLATQERERFTVLGDLLALRFHRGLRSFLDEMRSGRSATVGPDPARAESTMVSLYGGAFYQRAVERGVIRPGGNLDVPAITPSVLFRFRWRLFAGVTPTEGFEPVEQMALYDFTARFAEPDEKQRRLAAVAALEKLSRAYDATIARAIVLLEAGAPKTALDTLVEARVAGRSDASLLRFIRYLER